MSFQKQPLRWRARGLLALGASAAVGLAASGLTTGSTAAAASGGSTPAVATGASVSLASKHSPVNVAIELVQSGLAFTQETQAGAEAAAKQFGAHLSVSAPTQLNPTTAISQVNSALAQGAKGIAIADIPASSWTRELSTAMSQTNGNVVTFNSPPPSGTAKTYVGNSDLALGQKLAAATIKAAHLGPKTTGQVIISDCAPGASLLEVTAKGAEETVKKLLPKATVLPPFNSQPTPSANETAWQQEISAHPSAVLALGICDQDGDSMIKAKQSTGDKFAIGATDLDPLVLNAIAKGTVAADLAQNWYLEGYTAARMMITAARNHTAPRAGWFQPGTTVVTKANVAALEKRDASAAGLAAFYKPLIASFWKKIAAKAQRLSSAV